MKVFLKTKPNSKQQKIEKIFENSFQIWVKEPAKQGKANKAVIKVLTDYFNVSKSSIRIISGIKYREKILEIKSYEKK